MPRGERPVALLLFDLDHFKRINDLHGHAVGDGVLIGFCHTVKALLPEGAVFGRMGGEEFACLLPGLSRRRPWAKRSSCAGRCRGSPCRNCPTSR